jgi:hypothetical protein
MTQMIKAVLLADLIGFAIALVISLVVVAAAYLFTRELP